MTGIAGLVDGLRVWLAGDRAGVEQSHYLTIVSEPKVFHRGEMVMGYTSSFAMGRALQWRLKLPDLPADRHIELLDEWMNVAFADAVRVAFREAGYLKIENSRECGGQFLVGVRGALYVFDEDFHAHRPHAGIAAAGSGVSVILGSLFSTANREPEDRLRLALSAAANFTTTVRAPFDLVVTP